MMVAALPAMIAAFPGFVAALPALALFVLSMASERAIERLLLRPGEVAELISVSRARVYELIASGTIPSIKIPSSSSRPGALPTIRVSADALRAWIEKQGSDRA